MKIDHEQTTLEVGRGNGTSAKLVRLSLIGKREQTRTDIHLTPAEARVVATMLAETARELK